MKTLFFACTIIVALASFKHPGKLETDKLFMITAAQNNIAEVEVAKLALTQSTSDSVKSFAQRMIDDHTNALTELATLARSKGVTLPDSADDAHRMFKQRLMLVTGTSFDSAYAESQVRDHEKAVALFQAEVNNGLDPEVKAYASNLLPKLQMHLQHAQSVASNVGGNTGTNMTGNMNNMNNTQQPAQSQQSQKQTSPAQQAPSTQQTPSVTQPAQSTQQTPSATQPGQSTQQTPATQQAPSTQQTPSATQQTPSTQQTQTPSTQQTPSATQPGQSTQQTPETQQAPSTQQTPSTQTTPSTQQTQTPSTQQTPPHQ